MSDALALSTAGLQFFYGSRPVLKGLDLRVPRGSVFGFLGRNAAGKTTTLRLLIGMLRPHAGEIEIRGERYAKVTAEARRTIGFVSQEQHFYEWMKVRALGDFVASFYPTWSDDEFTRLLQLTRIESDQRVGELSGGTKMKLAIVLALAHGPPLVVLDEPTAGVDPAVRREILALLDEQAKRGQTILFSTHQIEEVRAIADVIGILHDGRMVFQGTPEEARRRYRRISVDPEALPPGTTVLARDEAGRLIVEADEGVEVGEPLELEDIFFFATGGRA